ncbi:MAG: hypothetical protein MK086_09580, partial [Flavobacteriales bacterium]|nr:hypothetical protein [Flavobacteriales bacterium]
MKKIFGLFIVMVPLIFSGCNDPEETDCIYADKRFCDPNFTGGNIGRELVEFSEDTENYSSKVLLEDFTGFRCTNCLPAIATAKSLKDQNPDRLSIIGVHCTPFFAAPITDDPNEPYHKDFRTPEGEFYVEHYGFQQLPTGIVNRQDDGPT